jgi:hypothetical protein
MKHRRRLAAMLLAGAATAATIGVASAPAQATPGYVRMNIWNSNHCLDNDTGHDEKLQMWRCSGGTEQQWLPEFNSQTQAFTFANRHTGRCIHASAAGAVTVTMEECDAGAPTQQWTALVMTSESPGGSYTVWQNKFSGLCLTTPSVGDGTLVQTTVCDSSDQYDRWHQEPQQT